MIGDLFGQSIAEGTIGSAINQCADALEQPEAQIKEALKQAEVAHFDEPGLYVAGRREWLHVASTSQLTHYGSHAKRGAEAIKDIGILPAFTGRAIHDAWAPYFNYSCAHGLCNAHHLRELTFINEQMGQAWAGEMKDLLIEIKQAVERAIEQGSTALSSAPQRRFEKNYDQLLAKGLGLPEHKQPLPSGKRGRPKQSKAKNLLDRLSQHKGETLAFMLRLRCPIRQQPRRTGFANAQSSAEGFRLLPVKWWGAGLLSHSRIHFNYQKTRPQCFGGSEQCFCWQPSVTAPRGLSSYD